MKLFTAELFNLVGYDLNILGKNIWQQAAGDPNRDYSLLCLKWGVILNGPGRFGKWPDCEEPLRKDGRASKKITDIRRFTELQNGDLVVLRIGTASVLGVGEIVGPYAWIEEFGDIDGWDLQHVRRVRWLWNGQENPKGFDTYALKWGDTTQKLKDGPVTEWLSQLNISEAASSALLPDLPTAIVQNDISVEQVSEFLFDRGVASSSITNLLNEIGELTRIAKWYQYAGKPSEHETVAYLVVPLLRALGWTPQRMAVEWKSVDVALFERLPRSDPTLQVVVEVKKMDNSCLSALRQAQSYANSRVACGRLIVTDGVRYGIYIRKGAEPFNLYAYMNLARLRQNYPVYGCKGAKDALLAMAPEWRMSDFNDTGA